MEECMMLSAFLSFSYILLVVFSNEFGITLPLFSSDISPVFCTFAGLISILFIFICLLEVFWFERNLNWNGKIKEK